MKKATLSFVRRVISDQAGQTLPFVALGMTALLGVAGLVVDVGNAYVVRGQLQNAANAAALAAAGYVYYSNSASVNTTTVGGQYGAGTGGENTYPGASTVISTRCVSMLMPKGTSCTSGSAHNAVVANTSVSVKTFFMGLFGVPTLTVRAMATASMQGSTLGSAGAGTWNVAVIVDSTGSMATTDSNCSGLTEFQCALSGTQALLGSSPPCPSGVTTCNGANANIRVGLFAFPNVLTAVNGALPVVSGRSVDSIADEINCNGSPGTYTTPARQPIAAPYTLPAPGASLLAYGGASPAEAAPSSYMTGLQYMTYKQTSTGSTWDATYQITPFLSDYFAPSAASGLNSSSNLVKAVGYGTTQGCLTYTLGIDGSNGGGSHFGNTYFASSIYAAQSALNAEQAAYGGNNAIIFLSDGQANASYFKLDSSAYGGSSPYYDSSNQYNEANEFPEGSQGSSSVTNEVGPSTSGYPVPAYLTPATILPAQKSLGYDMLSSSSSSVGGTSRSGTSKGIYPDWYDQCQQAITAAQYAAGTGTTVFAVAYGSESSGCSNGWSVGATDTTLVASGVNQPFTSVSQLLPCTTMEDIASSWSNFYSDNQQTGNVNLGCSDLNHSTVSLADIFQAIATTFTKPRLIPNNSQ